MVNDDPRIFKPEIEQQAFLNAVNHGFINPDGSRADDGPAASVGGGIGFAIAMVLLPFIMVLLAALMWIGGFGGFAPRFRAILTALLPEGWVAASRDGVGNPVGVAIVLGVLVLLVLGVLLLVRRWVTRTWLRSSGLMALGVSHGSRRGSRGLCDLGDADARAHPDPRPGARRYLDRHRRRPRLHPAARGRDCAQLAAGPHRARHGLVRARCNPSHRPEACRLPGHAQRGGRVLGMARARTAGAGLGEYQQGAGVPSHSHRPWETPPRQWGQGGLGHCWTPGTADDDGAHRRS